MPTRVTQQQEGLVEGFTKKYNVKTLVWFADFSEIDAAIQRQKTMKKWPRQWKINVIERENLDWNDLYAAIN